jgi:hypothetical protein
MRLDDVALTLSIYAPQSTFFATAQEEAYSTYRMAGNGDLWPSCWADDGNLYASNGDGTGFGQINADMVVNRISGMPPNLSGTTLATNVGTDWSGPGYNRKPTGMLCVNNTLYLAFQNLQMNTFNSAPAASIAKSTDHGATWTWDTSAPMFANGAFTAIFFLDFCCANSQVLGQGGVTYDAPLHRYIFSSWSYATQDFYESPSPWGPWSLFMSKDFGPIQLNPYSLRKLAVQPYAPTTPTNAKNDTNNLAQTGNGTTAISKSTRFGTLSGAPGGTSYFTSIAELAVYYAVHGSSHHMAGFSSFGSTTYQLHNDGSISCSAALKSSGTPAFPPHSGVLWLEMLSERACGLERTPFGPTGAPPL